MIRAHLHFEAEASWSRQTHWGSCGQSCGCCRAEHCELLGACQACNIAWKVEYIFTIIEDCLGPCFGMSRNLVAKIISKSWNSQLLVLSFWFDPWRPSLQQAGVVCMHLARKMVQQFEEEYGEDWNLHFPNAHEICIAWFTTITTNSITNTTTTITTTQL